MKKALIATLLMFTIIVNANSSEYSSGNIDLIGTVVSDGQKMIGSKYMGYVKKVYVKVGSKVKREDPLYEIESAEFDIMETQAELVLEQAKIVLEYWKTRLARIDKKRKKAQKRISTNKFGGNMDMDADDMVIQAENAMSMLEAAKMSVKQATNKAKQVATIYNYIKMKAPSDGVIVEKRIRVGDMVMPGMMTIMMIDMKNLEIDTEISEHVLRYVRVGKRVSIKIPSLDIETAGYIKTIVPHSNPMTHKIKMRIGFDHRYPSIFPGMYAKISFDQENGQKPYNSNYEAGLIIGETNSSLETNSTFSESNSSGTKQ